MPETVHPEPTHTQVLRAMGIGGFFGFVLAAAFLLNPWLLLAAMGIFFGTAALDAVIDAASEELAKQRKS